MSHQYLLEPFTISLVTQLLFALPGAVLGGGVVLAWRISDREFQPETPAHPVVPEGVAAVLSVLRSSALLVDESDDVLKSSAPAVAL